METIKNREERIKEQNLRQKNLAKIIGQNLSLYICIMIPVILIGAIWTEYKLPVFGWSLLCDGILTVALFVVGERSMIQIGVTGGKLDDEYLDVRKTYRALLVDVKKIGVLMLDPFCDWQIDVELARAKRTRLRRAGVKPQEYHDKYEGKSFEELKELVGFEKATKLHEINTLKPIELDADMLLTENYGSRNRRDIPEGAEQYVEKKKFGKIGIAVSILTAMFTIFPNFDFTSDITIARVIYTVVKLTLLLYRMARGYSNGAKAYNTIEVRHLNAKIEYLTEYIEFMNKRIYCQIADQYPEIQTFLTNPIHPTQPMEMNYEIQSQQPSQIPITGGD